MKRNKMQQDTEPITGWGGGGSTAPTILPLWIIFF